MFGLNLRKQAGDELNVLCLGAHSDDIEIGCGGTLLSLKAAFARLRFHWIVFSATGARENEAAKAAELFTAGHGKSVILKSHRDGFFPQDTSAIKEFFEETKARVSPDIIFTHWHADAHQDHRVISELTWNTFRNHLILEYEIPKYDGDMGRPSVFVPLAPEHYEAKVNYLFDAFRSQAGKHWFARETFLGLMRLRGMEANSPTHYAEAFYARKIVIEP
jgi:LmbE family N-acetylglucosaminyl deacetylase